MLRIFQRARLFWLESICRETGCIANFHSPWRNSGPDSEPSPSKFRGDRVSSMSTLQRTHLRDNSNVTWPCATSRYTCWKLTEREMSRGNGVFDDNCSHQMATVAFQRKCWWLVDEHTSSTRRGALRRDRLRSFNCSLIYNYACGAMANGSTANTRIWKIDFKDTYGTYIQRCFIISSASVETQSLAKQIFLSEPWTIVLLLHWRGYSRFDCSIGALQCK